MWPQAVVEVFDSNQTRRGGGLGGLGVNGTYVMATEAQMDASETTLKRPPFAAALLWRRGIKERGATSVRSVTHFKSVPNPDCGERRVGWGPL